jgi:hypothetical protein
MWRALLTEIFPQSDKSWTWRRRMAFAGCGVFLWGIVYSIAFMKGESLQIAVLGQCIAGFLATMGIYYKGSHEDQKLADALQEKLLLATDPKKGGAQ